MKRFLGLIVAALIMAMLLSGCSVRTNQSNNIEHINIPSCPVGNSEIVRELNAQDNNAVWSYFEGLYKYCLKIEVIKQELEHD